MTDDEKRPAGITAVRNLDADRLEASLGRLPAPVARPAMVVMIGLPGSATD